MNELNVRLWAIEEFGQHCKLLNCSACLRCEDIVVCIAICVIARGP